MDKVIYEYPMPGHIGPRIAYPGGAEQRATFIRLAVEDREADVLEQGATSNPARGGKGCMVACAVATARPEIESPYDHATLAEVLGVPEELAELWDAIFEALPKDYALGFPQQAFEALQPGADCSQVVSRWLIWLLVDPSHGVVKYAGEEGRAAIERVVGLHMRRIAGVEPDKREWDAARAAAWAAARDAASDAASDAANAAAWDAAWDAASAAAWNAARAATSDAARAAANAAARDAAWNATWAAAYQAQRDALLRLMAAAPIVEEATP